MCDNQSALNEFKQFLIPGTRKDVLESALELLLSLSTDEKFLEMLSSPEQVDDFCGQLCSLFQATTTGSSSRSLLLSILVNLTANQQHATEIASNLLKSTRFLVYCLEQCLSTEENVHKVRAAQFLSNLSRHFPHRLSEELARQDQHFLLKLIDKISMNDVSEKVPQGNNSTNTFLGFLLINLSTVQQIGHQIASNRLNAFIAMLSPNGNSAAKQMMALETIYNISLQDELHGLLFHDEHAQDSLLSALLAPLADADDQLEEAETDMLPPGLQYWEGQRVEDGPICQKVFSTLYQFCATRLGREMLRRKGIYPLLREFDKARQKEGGGGELAVGKMVLVDNGQGGEDMDMLRALIGILIRTEEDMGLGGARGEETLPPLESIRHLGQQEEQ